MNERMYQEYLMLCQKLNKLAMPNDVGTPPKYFGMSYVGSSRKRKNDNYRKHQAKYHHG